MTDHLKPSDVKIISRAEANASGQKRYFTGNPCPYGHVGMRNVANCACVECGAKWQSDHPVNRKKSWQKWYNKNIERQRAKAVEYRWSKVDERRQYAREYNSQNLDRLAAIARNRRSRAKKSGGKHTADDVRSIFEMQRGKCACCRIDLTLRTLHVDHIIPLARGGGNDRRNLQIMCVTCNKHKSAKDPIEFMQSQGRLI